MLVTDFEEYLRLAERVQELVPGPVRDALEAELVRHIAGQPAPELRMTPGDLFRRPKGQPESPVRAGTQIAQVLEAVQAFASRQAPLSAADLEDILDSPAKLAASKHLSRLYALKLVHRIRVDEKTAEGANARIYKYYADKT